MRTFRNIAIIVPFVLLAAIYAGCRGKAPESARTGPRVEDMSWGKVTVVISADPPAVRFDRDILLSIRITTPAGVEAPLPALEDRVRGFVLSGHYDSEPIEEKGQTTLERHARLTPLLADEYRLAPIPIQYHDESRGTAGSGWFPTRPMLFGVHSPDGNKQASDISENLGPLWIYPPFKTVASWTAAVLAGLCILFLAFKLIRKIKKKIELMQMSPKERALKELARLLARDLIGKDQVKEFYIELTMIVRRYIENRHSVRAPEQTTEEFLESAAENPVFPAEVISRLKAFLEAADLVKFAAHHPPPEAVDKATGTARKYIETDSASEKETP